MLQGILSEPGALAHPQEGCWYTWLCAHEVMFGSLCKCPQGILCVWDNTQDPSH